MDDESVYRFYDIDFLLMRAEGWTDEEAEEAVRVVEGVQGK